MASRRIIGGLLGTAGTLVALVTFGGGWTYSGQLLPAPARDRTLDVSATLTPDGTVLLTPERRACLETFGLLLPDGAFLTYGGPVVAGSCTGLDGAEPVERTVTEVVQGAPAVGAELPARFDEYTFGTDLDPGDVGLTFSEVEVPLEEDLGTAPAWRIDGDDDWVIMVHGRSGTRAEMLRLLPTVVEGGRSALVITHRNDMAGGPRTTDEVGRFGQTEWRDLRAAVAHARSQGAQRIVLVGFSQGGSVISYLLREEGQEGIDGVILDSPLLSLSSTLTQQARLRDIPDPLIPPILFGTRQLSRLRAGFVIGDVEHVDALSTTTLPMLLIHGDEDDFVPPAPSAELAARRPDGLTYLSIPGAGHVEGWNTDRELYTAAVRTFLDAVLG